MKQTSYDDINIEETDIMNYNSVLIVVDIVAMTIFSLALRVAISEKGDGVWEKSFFIIVNLLL